MRIATWNLERPKAKSWKRNPRLIAALHDNQLTAVTAQTPIGYTIDHICVSQEWQSLVQPLTPQNQFPSTIPDKTLSDHSGLYVDID
jgi:exonuclease III